MTAPLFDPPAEPGRELQRCDRCLATIEASVDGLRARGWVAYSGSSFTGKDLKVRICPDCKHA